MLIAVTLTSPLDCEANSFHAAPCETEVTQLACAEPTSSSSNAMQTGLHRVADLPSLDLPERPTGAVPDVSASPKPTYNAFDLASAVAVSPNTARNYLRWRFPAHPPESWWRLDAGQFENSKGHFLELKSQNPQRPLHRLHALDRDASGAVQAGLHRA